MARREGLARGRDPKELGQRPETWPRPVRRRDGLDGRMDKEVVAAGGYYSATRNEEGPPSARRGWTSRPDAT